MFAQTTRNYGDFHNQLVLEETGRNAKMRKKKKKYSLLCFSFVPEKKGKERNTDVMEYVKICKYVNFPEQIFLLSSIFMYKNSRKWKLFFFFLLFFLNTLIT